MYLTFQNMARFLVSGGFLCKHCQYVKGEAERCPDFARWDTDLCHSCCDAYNAAASAHEDMQNAVLLLQGQVSFYRSLFVETGNDSYFDIMSAARDQLHSLVEDQQAQLLDAQRLEALQ